MFLVNGARVCRLCVALVCIGYSLDVVNAKGYLSKMLQARHVRAVVCTRLVEHACMFGSVATGQGCLLLSSKSVQRPPYA